MKNKAFAVIVCLVLVAAMAIPGTLALSTDTDSSQTNATAEVPATPETPSETPAETLAPSEQPTEGTSEQPKQSTEEETPAPSETPKECTCDPKPAEGEAHKEGCPLYVKPVSNASKHIDTCTEGCTGEDCKCPCHLFDRLMACQTLEEIEAIIKATPEDVLKSLSEEQVAQVEAYMDSLMPAPLPAIVIEESEPPVESEIYRPTVNYTNVAPFGEPLTGGN